MFLTHIMESVDDIKCEIQEQKFFIKLLKRKAFPWSLMFKDQYIFGKGLGTKNEGSLVNVWDELVGIRYRPDNKYDFQKRPFFKQEIGYHRMMEKKHHKMFKMGDHETNILYWNLCTPQCDCDNRKKVAV